MLHKEYTAGLFDGEGWFTIDRVSANSNTVKTKHPYRYQAYAALQIREEHIAKSLTDTYGGSYRQIVGRGNNHSTTYRWTISGNNLRAFIKYVIPCMRCKSNQAEVVLKLLTLKQLNGNKPISQTDFNTYTDLYDQLKNLNLKGINK